MRKILLAMCLSAFCLGIVGCQTETSTIWSSAYWKRHAVNILQGFHEFRVDVDRIIFDLDDRPIEDL